MKETHMKAIILGAMSAADGLSEELEKLGAKTAQASTGLSSLQTPKAEKPDGWYRKFAKRKRWQRD